LQKLDTKTVDEFDKDYKQVELVLTCE